MVSPVATSTIAAGTPSAASNWLPVVKRTVVLTFPPFDSAWMREGVGGDPALRFSWTIPFESNPEIATTSMSTSAPVTEVARMSPSTAFASTPARAKTSTESAPPPGFVAWIEVIASPRM